MPTIESLLQIILLKRSTPAFAVGHVEATCSVHCCHAQPGLHEPQGELALLIDGELRIETASFNEGDAIDRLICPGSSRPQHTAICGGLKSLHFYLVKATRAGSRINAGLRARINRRKITDNVGHADLTALTFRL